VSVTLCYSGSTSPRYSTENEDNISYRLTIAINRQTKDENVSHLKFFTQGEAFVLIWQPFHEVREPSRSPEFDGEKRPNITRQGHNALIYCRFEYKYKNGNKSWKCDNPENRDPCWRCTQSQLTWEVADTNHEYTADAQHSRGAHH